MNHKPNQITPPKINGLLAVNKPYGLPSKDISRWLTKRLGKLKLGHVGTLDPRADGVLPILFGTATRLQDYLLDSPKVYQCQIQLGEETETLDTEGDVIKRLPWSHVTEDQVTEVIQSFIGEVTQVPPIYSAIKYKGTPLYQYARSGRESEVCLEDLKRDITVYQLDFLGFDAEKGTIGLSVTSSKGTYIRVLVRDIAEKLGTCGNMTKLTRVKSSGIAISDTYTLEQLEEKLDDFASIVQPIEDIQLDMPRWKTQECLWAEKLLAGQPLLMSTEVFAESIVKKDSVDLDKFISEKIAIVMILLDEKGKAFGIGSAGVDQTGRVKVIMKRGLL